MDTPKDPDAATSKLVLLQIDGLSFRQFRRAMREGRMPNCTDLLEKGGQLRPLYSGIPSSTPAFQAELFYGVPGAVPAFSFFDRRAGISRIMRRPLDIRTVAESRFDGKKPLLENGSVYSSIYHGGAEETHFNPHAFPEIASSLRRFYHLHFYSILGLVRILGRLTLHLPLELLRSVAGLLQGLWLREPFREELNMIGTRLAVKILAREIIHEGIIDDIRRGLPVIQANFLAYDECAHRRGPETPYAHRALTSIDNVIGSIHHFVRRKAPGYRILVYSDHGQETVEPYSKRHPLPFVKEVERLWREHRPTSGSRNPIVCDKGPLGHVYFPQSLGIDECRILALKLARISPGAGVIWKDREKRVFLVHSKGTVPLQEAQPWLLTPHHRFRQWIMEDLYALAQHPDSGDLIALGWTPHAAPSSFAEENGAHAGPGPEETCAFLFAPSGGLPEKEHLRGRDLYDFTFRLLRGDPPPLPVSS